MPINTLQNAKQKPQVYYARHMFPGVAEYHNERILVDSAAMKKMAKTMEGCPVYVEHQDVDYENIQNADGFIADNFVNPLDHWTWSKFVIISDRGHEAIKNGYRVSNAYIPTESGSAGTQHNVDYNRKILNGKYTHLAIVKNPRYEEAKIFTPEEYKSYNAKLKESELSNSKTGKPTMKLFKFSKEAVTADKVDADTQIELADGTHKPLSELINAIAADKAAEKTASDEAAAKAAAEAEKKNSKVTVAGEEMTVAELVEKYNAKCEKEKMSAKEVADKKEKDEKEKKDKENALTEKKNSANFDEIANAKNNAATADTTKVVETSTEQLARGKSRY